MSIVSSPFRSEVPETTCTKQEEAPRLSTHKFVPIITLNAIF